MSVGTKKGEVVLLSGLLIKPVLDDSLFTFVVMEPFREMNLAQEPVVNSLEYLVVLVFTTKSGCVVDDGASIDSSIWFVMVGFCLSRVIGFRFLSLSHLLDEERVF